MTEETDLHVIGDDHLAGTQGQRNHAKKDRLFELIERMRLPTVFFAEGGGGRPGDTDYPTVSSLEVRAFKLWAALSGVVPRIAVVKGRCFAGNAVIAGCSDLIVATEDTSIGMGGPAMIAGGGLGDVDPDAVGPISVQAPNGVVDVVVPDEAAAVMALIENMQREDLNPLEQAQGLKRLVDEFGLTHEQAAQAVGRSRSAASNLLRLLQLSEPVQQMLMAGDLDMGHARALLALDGAQQISAANQVAGRKLSVREAERLVARVAAGAGRQAPLLRVKADKPREIVRLESALADALTAPVEIRVKKRTQRGERGEIAIRFDSLDELDALLDKLGVPSR